MTASRPFMAPQHHVRNAIWMDERTRSRNRGDDANDPKLPFTMTLAEFSVSAFLLVSNDYRLRKRSAQARALEERQ
jgi:hypothetical protein